MLVSVHVRLLHEALAGQVSSRALSAIQSANLAQDQLRYQVDHDEFHFDNNEMSRSFDYLEEQRRLIPQALEQADPAPAWAAFGRLTHTAQDFYSHTNYVDLWLSRHASTQAGTAANIDPLEAELLVSPELRSGRLYYPVEALYFIRPLRKFALSLLPPDSHAHMNLDSEEQGPRFEYAFQAALKRTRLELERVRNLLSPGLYRLFCDLDGME